MSNRLMDLAWPLPIPPSPKVVLVALADQADDAGTCWPSIPSLCQRTSLGRTAVIEAVKWLEKAGLVSVSRDARCNRYVVTPSAFDQSACRTVEQSACRTSPPAVPVRLPDGDQSASRTDQSASRTTPVRQPDPNPQEPSITPKKATPKTRPVIALPEWLPEEAWADWVAHRKATKHPMTPKAEELSIADLGRLREQGHDPVAVIHHAIKSGWRGLYAPPVRAGPNPGNHSAAANFRGKRYDATPDDKLPPGLR